jgi:protease I
MAPPPHMEPALGTVLVPIPSRDFDPTEVAVPWKVLEALGHTMQFATPDGRPGQADERMVTGQGLGIWKAALRADANARQAYAEMVASREFMRPGCYSDFRVGDFDGLILPGGHAPGMKPYLQSSVLQALVVAAFEQGRPVGAICHGVVLAARSRSANGRSVLYGRKTTALTRVLELTAWVLTAPWLGNYYRTYATTVQREVSVVLASPADFFTGPIAITRDAPSRLDAGFTVLDGSYLSARWPGDAHRFANDFGNLLRSARPALAETTAIERR